MSVIEFREWPKIARWDRPAVITEKIDGTNACVVIVEDDGYGGSTDGLAYTVAVILKISGAPLDKATYWVLVGIFATLQALYWQLEDDRA